MEGGLEIVSRGSNGQTRELPPGTSTTHERTAQWVLLSFVVASVSALPVLIELIDGFVWQGDSPAYVAAAYDLYEGKSTDWFSSWPLGFPAFLSIGLYLGSFSSFVLVAHYAVSVSIALVSIGLARNARLPWPASMAVGVVVGVSPALYESAIVPQADALFSLLAVGSLYCMTLVSRHGQRLLLLLLAALLISAASVTKNLGFVLLVPYLLTIAFSVLRKWVSWLWGCALLGVAVAGYVATWWRNNSLGVSDRGLGGPGGWYSASEIALQTLQWSGGILAPPSVVWVASLAGLVALAAVAIAPLVQREARFTLGILAVFTYCYLGVFGFFLLFNPNSPLEWRYMLPVIPIVVVCLAVVAHRSLTQVFGEIRGRILTLFALYLWGSLVLMRTLLLMRDSGGGSFELPM